MKKIIFLSISTIVLATGLFSQKLNSSDEKKILSLIERFSDKDLFIQGDAIRGVVHFGNKAVDYLVRSLADTNDDVRICSAIALDKIAPEGTKAIPSLINALKDESSDVRWCSAIALGKFRGNANSVVNGLQKLLNDKEYNVRWAAYTSLNAIDKKSINVPHDFSDVVDTLESLTPQLMKEFNIPGVSISIIKNNAIVYSKGFGVSDAFLKTEVTNKTIFEACSMSKPVFAFLVLQLVDQKKLDLDKPLFEYLPEQFVSENKEYAKQITARMILTHTSGMPNWRKSGDEREAPLPIYFKPGTKFSYSGEGMFYLQRVVEHITNEPLASFAQRMLFGKLGLQHTSFVWTEKLNPNISTGHNDSGKCNERSKYLHANAAYTLYTTPNEYAQFLINIMKPNKTNMVSLSELMTKEIIKHQVRVDVREVVDRPGRSLGLFSFRGLGWGIDSTITGNIVYHSGSNQTGFRCYSQFNNQEGSGIVIMTNSENGSELWQRLIKVVGDL
jgi:CubicO group peptidase (beta-lactamase class C family)